MCYECSVTICFLSSLTASKVPPELRYISEKYKNIVNNLDSYKPMFLSDHSIMIIKVLVAFFKNI